MKQHVSAAFRFGKARFYSVYRPQPKGCRRSYVNSDVSYLVLHTYATANMTQIAIKTAIKKYFLNQNTFHTVVLYGSMAGENFTANSDVDIAVAADHPLAPEERVELHQDLEKLLARRVDMRDLSTLHGIILYQVLYKGIVVKKENLRYFERKIREMVVFMQDIYPILERGMEQSLREYVDAG